MKFYSLTLVLCAVRNMICDVDAISLKIQTWWRGTHRCLSWDDVLSCHLWQNEWMTSTAHSLSLECILKYFKLIKYCFPFETHPFASRRRSIGTSAKSRRCANYTFDVSSCVVQEPTSVDGKWHQDWCEFSSDVGVVAMHRDKHRVWENEAKTKPLGDAFYKENLSKVLNLCEWNQNHCDISYEISTEAFHILILLVAMEKMSPQPLHRQWEFKMNSILFIEFTFAGLSHSV